MKLRMKWIGMAVAGAFAWPLAASAQQGGTQEFAAMDRDGNGFVSMQEWNQARAGGTQDQGRQASAASGATQPEWVVITLTPVERQLMDEQRRESTFRAIDTNSNGAISPAEAGLNTSLLHAFSQLDRNNDGMIERQEFARVHVDDGSGSQQSGGGQSSMQQQSRR
jgi:Ca2+-binding EF-hand superfamily protein